MSGCVRLVTELGPADWYLWPDNPGPVSVAPPARDAAAPSLPMYPIGYTTNHAKTYPQIETRDEDAALRHSGGVAHSGRDGCLPRRLAHRLSRRHGRHQASIGRYRSRERHVAGGARLGPQPRKPVQ